MSEETGIQQLIQIQAIADAASQLAGVGVQPDAAVVKARDFWAARTVRASGSGQFLAGDPLNPLPPTLWGLPLVISPAMPHGGYLVGHSAPSLPSLTGWIRLLKSAENTATTSREI
jgi:hypothetical protein